MGVRFIDSVDDVTVDGEQVDFRGGADEFATATQLGDNQSGRLINSLVEDNGRPKVRPGADALGGSALVASRINRLVYFDTPTLELLFAAVSTRLEKWDRTNWTNIAAYPFGGNAISDMAQGNNLLYCSDATGQWNSYDGAAWAALGAAATDPPVGTSIMCWHTNRMFAAGILGGFSDRVDASKLGVCGTGDWLTATWSFRVGQGEGQAVTALASIKGNYLCVGKEASIYLVDTDPTAASAAAWFIRRLSNEVGVVGKRAMVAFGDSAFVLARDGVREIAANTGQDTPFELSPPLSEPMQPYIDRINLAAANTAQLHKYRHYLLVAIPLDAATDPSHVLVYNARTRSWMGVWTGWTPTAFCTSRFGADGERLCIGDTAGMVNAWKDYASQDLDSTFQDNGVGVAWTGRTKAWNFGSQRNLKDGASIELDFVSSKATATIKAVFDGTVQRTWVEPLTQPGLLLAFTLPATLPMTPPKTITKSIDGLPAFREAYLEVTTTDKRIELKRASLDAYVNTYETE